MCYKSVNNLEVFQLYLSVIGFQFNSLVLWEPNVMSMLFSYMASLCDLDVVYHSKHSMWECGWWSFIGRSTLKIPFISILSMEFQSEFNQLLLLFFLLNLPISEKSVSRSPAQGDLGILLWVYQFLSQVSEYSIIFPKHNLHMVRSSSHTGISLLPVVPLFTWLGLLHALAYPCYLLPLCSHG